MKIGVFDSGIGGITVLNELTRRFPGADYVYLGDTANLPYGTKSPAQVKRLSTAAAATLKKQGVDALVVACNTASSLALDEIRAEMGTTPVLGVVRPGVEAAIRAVSSLTGERVMAPILVLATRATVKSESYGKTLRELLSPDLVISLVPCPIIEQACPLLVPMIEEGWLDHPVLHQTIREYVAPHLRTEDSGVALLGCTHYPWIHTAFEKALPGWIVVNSAQAVADSFAREHDVSKIKQGDAAAHKVTWIFTDPDALPAFAKELMK